ncbi:MAG: endonuclease MutS2 [Lachnospiraceae bacterium]|nr:endonuclease MutS2 [Lachnospiraceae bacterium]
MNEKALKTLEYTKIIEKLTSLAGSELGKEKCRNLTPSSDIEEIRTRQAETASALQRIYKKGSLSFSGIHDIRASIKRLEIHSCLGMGELMHISSVLTATDHIKSYGQQEEGAPDDALSERFRLLEPLRSVNHEILRCIISEDEMADDASAGLRSVRRSIKTTNDKIRDQLNSIINSQDNKLILQDNLITMRDGRFCIPVKSEYKNSFAGMIHDQSSSGSTVFIEPMAVVKLNNDLRELAIKEKEEIEKVLEALSSMLFQETANLKYNIDTIAEFDFIFARGTMAKIMKATCPEFNDRGYVNIKRGRHPLIDEKKVVPINIYLGKDFTMLVITGPNTGGKTVSLKTVGLFTLMGQAGLHIPAFEGSELAVFDEVYADIGDEQSIEQSLSTFSSHMKNTVSILKEADEKSLVLFDELGAGTDPTEGAALAMSILTFLHNRDIRVMATTHYAELKLYALSTPGVSNACCEFDVETLSPTYKLLIGIPGKSNAFAISKKLGIGDEIIDMAESFIGTRDKSFEDILGGLEKNRIDTENALAEAEKIKQEALDLKNKWEEKQRKLDNARDRVMNEANEKAARILQEAKDYADESIRKMNKLMTSGQSMREMEHERGALRDILSEKNASIKTAAPKKKKNTVRNPEDIKIGDLVHVNSFDVNAKVAGLPNPKGELYVMIGAMRTSVNIKDIELLENQPEEEEKRTRTGAGSIARSKQMTISPECNIIGMRVDEALPIVDKYLDDAYLAHLPKCSIIHGRGTGALKSAVHAHLKKLKYVKEFRLGSFGEGDQGVTIVEFKEN